MLIDSLSEKELEILEILSDPVKWITVTTGEAPRWYQVEMLRDPSLHKVFRMGRRCMVAGTPILMADGNWKPIERIRVDEKVMARNNLNQLIPKKVTLEYSNGIKDVYRIKLSNGLYIDCTDNHPLLILEPNESGRGAHYVWKSIEGGLKPGDKAIVNKGYDKWGNVHNPKLGALLGYLMTDGYIPENGTPKFTNNNLAMLKEVQTICEELYKAECRLVPKGNGYDLYVSGGLKEDLCKLGLLGLKRDREKLLDEYILWDKETCMAYINRMFSGDGGANMWSNGKNRTATELSVCSPSYKILDQVRLILLKIGVIGHINTEVRQWNGQDSILHKLRISDSTSIENFFTNVGYIYGKEEQCRNVLQAVQNKAKRRRYGTKQFSRVTIKSIEYLDKQLTYDIGVDGLHNFVANGIVCHNTGGILPVSRELLETP